MERIKLHFALKILILLSFVIGYVEMAETSFDFQTPFMNQELLDLFTFSPNEIDSFGKEKYYMKGELPDGNGTAGVECDSEAYEILAELLEADLLKKEELTHRNHSISRRAVKSPLPELMPRPTVSLSKEGLLVVRWSAPHGPPVRHYVVEGRLGDDGTPWKTVLVTSSGAAREARVVYPADDKQWRLRVKAVYVFGPGEPSEEVGSGDLEGGELFDRDGDSIDVIRDRKNSRKGEDGKKKSVDDVPVFQPLGYSEDEEDYLEDYDEKSNDGEEELSNNLEQISASPTSCYGSSEIPGLERCFERVNSSVVKECLTKAGFGETSIQCHKKKKTLESFKRLSEECLQKVYQHCFHNPMWRSKDLSSNEIEISIDIESLEDIEVNECDTTNVDKLILNAENCLKDKTSKNWPTAHNEEEELQKIFLVASYCAEEKQDCVVKSRHLFDRAMTSVMDITREFALQRVTKSESVDKMSTCFESFDYDKLGGECVDDFFDFAEALLEDRTDVKHYKKIRSCFQEKFDQCPESVLKLTIDTLLRATGGGGAMPWPQGVWGPKKRSANEVTFRDGLPVKPRGNSMMEKCDSSRIKKWIRQVDSSIFPILHNSQVELERSLRTTLYAVMHTLLVCHMQTLQSVELAISEILILIRQYCGGCSDSCAKAIDYANLQVCYKEMTSYYIHAYPRYKQEEILHLFSKAKLCTVEKLKSCPSMLPIHLSRLYLTILFGTECAADKGPIISVSKVDLNIKCQIIWSNTPCGDKLFIPPKPDCLDSFVAPSQSYHQSFHLPPTEKVVFLPMTRQYSDKYLLEKMKINLPQLDCVFWTPWISLYQPQSSNVRYLETILVKHCRNVTQVECRVTQKSPDGTVSMLKVPCQLQHRFVCESAEGGCFGFEVRAFCWDCGEQIELPAPTSLQRFTPKPKKYTARMYRPTEGYHMITVGTKSYHQRMTDVPKKKFIFKPHVTWIDFERPKPTTAVYRWIPKTGKYGKKWRPTQSYDHIVQVTPTIYKGEVKPATTAIEIFIPPTKSYKEKWTPPPVVIEKFKAKAKLYHMRVPSIGTEVVKKTPPTKSYRHRISPGIALTQHIKMINIKHQQFKPQTTRSIVVHLPEVIEDNVVIPVPPTVMNHHRFKPRHYTQSMTPKRRTRGRLMWFSEEKRPPATRPPPTTIREHYRFVPRQYTDYQKPLTARVVKVLLNTDYEHHLAPKDTTTLVRYTPRPKTIRRQTVLPTKASFFTIKFERKNYGLKFADTTKKWFGIIPKIKKWFGLFTVAPTTISMFHRHGCSKSCAWMHVTGQQMSIIQIVQACPTCRYPFTIECRVRGSMTDFRRTGDRVICDLQRGFVCHESNPAACLKYEVRVICCLDVTFSPWIRTANPTSPAGEHLPMRELLALYHCNFPVDIKCRALESKASPRQLDQVVSCNLRDGLACLNKDQPNGACFKYEVQITCCQCGYKQKIVPTRLRYATAPLKPIVTQEEERIRQTTKFVYPPPTKTYHQKITPPSDKFVHFAASKFYHGNTFKPATYFVTFKPPGKKYTHRFIKTTQRPHLVPLTSGIHERFRTDATGLYKYKPPTKSYDGRITPTTVKHVFASLISKRYQGSLENQPTKKLKVFVPYYRPPQKITPTESHKEFFPVTGNVYHGEHTNLPTTIVQSHFVPRRYTNKISGTTTRRHYAPITVALRYGTKKNPFRQHRVQVVPLTYAYRYAPTSTQAEFMPMEVKVYKGSRTNAPVTKYQCKHCYGQYKVNYTEDVYCNAPRGATLISCSDFYGSKENCSQIVLTQWKQSIKDCLMKKGVYSIGQHVDRATFLKVKADLLSCILVVGDTVCRESIDMVSFLLGKIFEICRGDCSVKSVPQMRNLNVDVTRKLKMCISQVNSNELEYCYPGLHETLMEAFVHDKQNAYLKINPRDSSCLSQSFQHCDAQSLKSLEELVYENYGLCIEVTSPGQKKGCHVDTYSHYCSETDVRIFIGKTENCARDDQGNFPQFDVAKRLDVLEKCMSQYPVNCIFPNWEVFREILFYLVDQILDSPGGDKSCLEEFQPEYLQECSQTLVSVISSFTASKVALNRGTMKTIQNCFKDSIGSCDSEVQSKFLSILQSVTHSAYLVDEASSPANMFRSIDSVRSGNQEVNICMKRFEDLSNEDDTLSDNDLCNPLLSSNNMSRSHILKKSCDGDDVTKWLSDVKKCVHSLSTSSHGMMTLVSLLKVIKSCNEKSALECRPKERKEFKSIVNSLFYTINLFAVPSGSTSCLSSLKVDNIVRCHNHLHQYLVLDFKSSPEAHRRKSEDCLTGALKSCSRSFVLDLLSVLEDCVGKHTSRLALSDGSYMACEPGTQNFPRNAQEYKKYCRPRSEENVPTEPYAAEFYRKLPDDEKGLRSQGKRHTENYLDLSGNKGEERKKHNSFGNMFPNYLDEDNEYSEEDGSNYGMNLKSGNYDLNKKKAGLKTDENYSFYISDIKDESSKEEPGIKPYDDEALNMRPSIENKKSYVISYEDERSDRKPSNRGLENLDPSVVDTEENQSYTSSDKKDVMNLMFRSLSNNLDDEPEEENLDDSKLKISTVYPQYEEISKITVPVLNLETSSKSHVENGEGSNEISGDRKGSIEKLNDSSKKYDDVEKCTIDDFDSYLDPLFDCQNIHMSLLFSSNQSTCSSITERSFETLALCLFEHKIPLTCEVSTKKQLEDFLAFLSLRLDTVMIYYRRHCSLKEPPCYESTKGFAHCSDDIYNHLIEPTSERGPLKVFQCLASSVPKCSSEIPLMFLPSVYLPLGMNLSSVLQETKEKKCLAATTADIPLSSVCTEAEKEAAMQSIYSCLNRTNQKINESLQGADQTLHWSVLPMTVCVSVYPILECRQTDLDKFKQFVFSFLTGIETWMKVFFQIFVDKADKKKGEDCLLQFTSPAMDKCLSLMFEYMTSFHSGYARSSDYPSQCVEDIFGGCGDIDTFHLLLKKSMNVTYEEDGSESERKDPRVNTCLGMENEVYSKNCDAKQFDSLLSSEEKCDAKRGDVLADVEDPIDFCKDCILKNVKDMCVYEMPQLKEVVSSALNPTERCWKTHDIGKTCIQNVRMALEDKCLFDFHAYISNVKRGRYMKAAHFSRNTYNCINKTVTQCSAEVHSLIFNFYSRITGVEHLSNYRADYVLGLNRAVNEIMM